MFHILSELVARLQALMLDQFYGQGPNHLSVGALLYNMTIGFNSFIVV